MAQAQDDVTGVTLTFTTSVATRNVTVRLSNAGATTIEDITCVVRTAGPNAGVSADCPHVPAGIADADGFVNLQSIAVRVSSRAIL